MKQPECSFDRRAAAALLRAARAASESPARDAIDWALLALPDCPGAQRLKIRQLVHQADGDAADALLARSLRARPRDRGLRLLLAQRQLQAAELDRAWRTINELIQERPHHAATLQHAATIARARGDRPSAIALLRRAMECSRAARRSGALIALIETCLEADQLDEAERLLDSMADAPAPLWAELRRRQGRWLEVVDILEAAAAQATQDADRDSLLCELIESLEVVGDMARLDAVTRSLGSRHPRATIRAGQARLAQGEFAAAARLGRSVSGRAAAGAPALMVLHVAATMADRPRLAQRALDLLLIEGEEIDTGAMARAWRCGIRGRLLADQTSAVRSGADPESGVLHRLIEEAAGVFDEALALGATDAPDRPELIRHRAQCAAALTRHAA